MGSKHRGGVLFFLRNIFTNFNTYISTMEKKEKIRFILFSAILSMLGALTVSFINTRADKVNNAAPIEYVDQKDKELLNYIDIQDNKLFNYTQRVEDKGTKNADEMRKKIDKMYEILLDWSKKN